MPILDQLGVALGLASLAGLNLYLTVLLVGLAIRFDWLHVAAHFQSLDVLAHPVVLLVAAVLFALEFLADKVPWVDSLWDSVHTFIRPVGGALLALQVVGGMPPYLQFCAAIVAGTAALTLHGAKAGTRLVANHTPEPASNIALSLGEDVAVAGGVVLTLLHPVIALGVFGAIVVILWFLFPRIWRGARTTAWLVWKKLRMPGERRHTPIPVEIPRVVDEELRELIGLQAGLEGSDVHGTVSCLSGKGKGIRGLAANLKGTLLLSPRRDFLHFAAVKGLSDRVFRIPLEGAKFEAESKFLSENLVVEGAGYRAVFRFPRGEGDLLESVVWRLRDWAGQAVPAAPETRPAAAAKPSLPAVDPDAPTTPMMKPISPVIPVSGQLSMEKEAPETPADPPVEVQDPPSELRMKPVPPAESVEPAPAPASNLEDSATSASLPAFPPAPEVGPKEMPESLPDPESFVSPNAPTVVLPRPMVMPRPAPSNKLKLDALDDPPAISPYPRMPFPPAPEAERVPPGGPVEPSPASAPGSEQAPLPPPPSPEPEVKEGEEAPLVEDVLVSEVKDEPAKAEDAASDEPPKEGEADAANEGEGDEKGKSKDSVPPFPVI